MKFSRLKKILFAIIVTLIAVFVVQAVLYQTYAHWRAKKYPAPGMFVDVGGCKLHVIQKGEGTPSVILEAGFACFSLVWNCVQPKVAEFTRVYSYDRAGLGWSERSPAPRISKNMIQELHALLEKINAPKPYILVGHSFGGLLMQLYANTYPDDVYGLVLVDSSHEQMIEKSWEFNRTSYHLLPSTFQRQWHALLNAYGMETLSNFTGIRAIYLRSLTKNALACIPPDIKKAFLARELSPEGIYTRGQEMRHIAESHQYLAQSKNRFSDKPLVVISRGKVIDEADPEHLWPYLTKAHLEVWNTLQHDLATKSNNSTHIIAANSGHTIIWSEPDLIVNAIHEMVERYRAVQQQSN